MKSRKFYIFFLLFFTSSLLFSEQLIFKYVKGSKYRIITNVHEKVYIDGEFNHSVEYLNKIAIEFIAVDGNKGQLSALFQVSEKIEAKDQIYHLEEEANVTYWRDGQGKMEEKPQNLYPIVRNVPLFPKRNLSMGDTWKATGKEFHDFRIYNLQLPIEIPIEVNYLYEKNITIDKTDIAVLKMNYEISRELPELRFMSGIHPLNIYGKVNQTYYWDIKKGRVYSYEDTFNVVYYYNNNQIVEFVGNSDGKFLESPDMNKDKIKDEIEESIKKEDIKDTTVSSDDEGVTITLENIQFTPESDILLPVEQEKLKKIAKILKKYPERDLLIAGHTALAGTEEGRKILSNKRAKAVGDYLFLLGVRNYMIFKGYGARIPIADNKTEKGMKKNRRVEIKILEN